MARPKRPSKPDTTDYRHPSEKRTNTPPLCKGREDLVAKGDR